MEKLERSIIENYKSSSLVWSLSFLLEIIHIGVRRYPIQGTTVAQKPTKETLTKHRSQREWSIGLKKFDLKFATF